MISHINISHPELFEIVSLLLESHISITAISSSTIYAASYMRVWNTISIHKHTICIGDNINDVTMYSAIKQAMAKASNMVSRELPYFTRYTPYESADGIDRIVDLMVMTCDMSKDIGYDIQDMIDNYIETISQCAECCSYSPSNTLSINAYKTSTHVPSLLNIAETYYTLFCKHSTVDMSSLANHHMAQEEYWHLAMSIANIIHANMNNYTYIQI